MTAVIAVTADVGRLLVAVKIVERTAVIVLQEEISTAGRQNGDRHILTRVHARLGLYRAEMRNSKDSRIDAPIPPVELRPVGRRGTTMNR